MRHSHCWRCGDSGEGLDKQLTVLNYQSTLKRIHVGIKTDEKQGV